MPLLTLDRVSLAFGHLPLVDGANLQVEAGERVCVVGQKGSGKSTLRILSGEQQPDLPVRRSVPRRPASARAR